MRIRALAGLLAAVLVAGVVVAVTGTAGGARGSDPVAAVTPTALPLDRAIPRLNLARAAVLADVVRIDSVANLLDEVHAAAATGDPGKVSAQQDVAAQVAKAQAVVARLPDRVAQYAAALQDLHAADRGLSAAQRAAVGAVVERGQAEADAIRAFIPVATAAVSAYARLAEREAQWYERARSGWYRSTAEAANAYAVAVDGLLGGLDRARHDLAQADRARSDASSAETVAVQRARNAFAAGIRT